MRKYFPIIIIIILFTISCDAVKKAETILPTKIKGKGMYVLKLKNLSLSDWDYKRSLLNNPLPAYFFIKENGILIHKINLGQTRGLKAINKHVVVSYNPDNNYRVGIGEEGIIAQSSRRYYDFPKGEWGLDRKKLTLGKDSWIEVGIYWVPSMEYQPNKKWDLTKQMLH